MIITPTISHAPFRTSIRQRVNHRDALALLLILAAFLLLTAWFIPQQSIWVDETTQMSGLAMGPVEVVSFLTGKHAAIGVPPDRMPPLSYWVGHIWAALFGLTESSMRWFGAICVAGAIACVYFAARRLGRWPALAASGFLALSPAVLNIAVEIRPYPLFLLIAAAATWTLLSIFSTNNPRSVRRRAAVLAALLIAGIFTHFFGVMLAGALLAGWLADALLRRKNILPAFVVSAAVAISILGLVPFIHAASGFSDATKEHAGLAGNVAKLAYHLLAHPAMRLIGAGKLTILLLALAAAFVALFVGFIRLLFIPRLRGIACATFAGTLALLLAAVVIKSFNPLSFTYNVWLMPLLAIILAASLTTPRGIWRNAASASAITLLLCGALGSIALARHGTAFAHGPQNQLFATIQHYGPQNVTLIQDPDDAGNETFSLLFPLRYHFGESLQRFSIVHPKDALTLTLSGYDDNERVRVHNGVPLSPMPTALRKVVVVVRSQDLNSAELINAIQFGMPPLADGPAASALKTNPALHLVNQQNITAMEAARIIVFEQAGAAAP